MLRGDAVVGCQRQPQPATRRRAIDGDDDRHGHLQQRGDCQVVHRHEFGYTLGRVWTCAHPLEVGAQTERRAGGGQHDRSPSLASGAETCHQRLGQLRYERIASLGPIDDDDRNPVEGVRPDH